MEIHRLKQIIKEEIQKVLEGFIKYDSLKPHIKNNPISGASNTIYIEIPNLKDFMAEHGIKDQNELEREIIGTLKMKYGTGTSVILNGVRIHSEENPLERGLGIDPSDLGL